MNPLIQQPFIPLSSQHGRAATKRLAWSVAVAALSFGLHLPVHAEFIAGLEPFQRPADAPVIKTYVADQKTRAGAVQGIDEPRDGIEFLQDQGAWYTPFTQPNMPGHYDIRHFYQRSR